MGASRCGSMSLNACELATARVLGRISARLRFAGERFECTSHLRYKADQGPALLRTWDPYGSRALVLRTMMRYALERESYRGFEQVQEDFYKVYFRDVEIGEFAAEDLRFRPIQVMR